MNTPNKPHLPKLLDACLAPVDKSKVKAEIEALDKDRLPLQAGLQQSSYVGPSPFSVMILNQQESSQQVHIRAGVFYTGIIAGCNCADDPSTVDELNEYCEISIHIDKNTSLAEIALSTD